MDFKPSRIMYFTLVGAIITAVIMVYGYIYSDERITRTNEVEAIGERVVSHGSDLIEDFVESNTSVVKHIANKEEIIQMCLNP